MAVPQLRQPAQASPEPQYIVGNGISGTKLIEPLVTWIEADAAAIRLSTEKPHTVEVAS